MSTLQNFNMLAGLNGPALIPGVPAGLQQLLARYGVGGGLGGGSQMAPGTNFSRPTTQWGTPIPQSPFAIGPLSDLAMGIGRGSLNQWPPIASRPVMGGSAGANNIPWLQQQAQMQQQAVRPPWMNTQPISGSTY